MYNSYDSIFYSWIILVTYHKNPIRTDTITISEITTTLYSYIKGDNSALPICRGHFSPNNSQETSIARPSVWGMGVSLEFEVWPTFYLRVCCAGCNLVLYFTGIYRGSIVFKTHLLYVWMATEWLFINKTTNRYPLMLQYDASLIFFQHV